MRLLPPGEHFRSDQTQCLKGRRVIYMEIISASRRVFLTLLIISAGFPLLSNSTMSLSALALGIICIVGPFYASVFAATAIKTAWLESVPRSVFWPSRVIWIVIALGAPAMAAYAAYFYTGRTPLEMLDGNSYLEYQEFFRESLANTSIVQRIPGIVAVFLLKAALMISIYGVFRHEGTQIGIRLAAVIAALSCAYYSQARGTNIEMFEIFVGYVSAICLFRPKLLSLRGVDRKWVLGGAAVAGAFFALFYSRVTGRASLRCFTADICAPYVDDGLNAVETIQYLSYLLSAYFSYGMYFSGSVIEHIYAFSPLDFLSGIGFGARHGSIICGSAIDCGANWESYLSLIVASGGLFLLLATGAALGLSLKMAAVLFTERPAPAQFILFQMLFALILTFFFGNFFVSSANILLLTSAGVVVLLNKLDSGFSGIQARR